MTSQLDIKFSRIARDRGIKKAADHAGADWNDKAYQLFMQWVARQSRPFTIEVFRAYAADKLPMPPSLRAFGGIAMRAAHARLIKKVGITQVKNEKAHMAFASLWQKM